MNQANFSNQKLGLRLAEMILPIGSALISSDVFKHTNATRPE